VTTYGASNYFQSLYYSRHAEEFIGKIDHQFFPWWYANFSYMHFESTVRTFVTEMALFIDETTLEPPPKGGEEDRSRKIGVTLKMNKTTFQSFHDSLDAIFNIQLCENGAHVRLDRRLSD
jgi:hypothetical protein